MEENTPKMANIIAPEDKKKSTTGAAVEIKGVSAATMKQVQMIKNKQ